jgi:heparinase II/III-like protein
LSKLRTFAQIGRTFGLRDGALRLEYEIQRSTGWMDRRMRSAAGWDHWSLSHVAPGVSAEDLLRRRRDNRVPFFFNDARTLKPALEQVLSEHARQSLQSAAEQILVGTFPYFDRLSYSCGFPPRWYENPATGERVQPSRSWTTMRFASPDYGDLKYILEPSRFLFVYPLARAYALTRDEKFPAAFWAAIENWANSSPPMSGPLWICGQESSLRILAWSFALYAFLNSPATTQERVSLLTSLVAAHAWRAEQTLGYARSQRSNHLISEAVGLWTAAVLFPELRASDRWRETGAILLQEATVDQITPEGLHLQYSFSYQRMVIHLLLWTLRLAQVQSLKLPVEVNQRAAAALSFLRAVVDPVSGRAPNFGANDGTLIFPLSSCDFGDYRPLLQLGSAVLGQSGLPRGEWDEAAVWFGAKPQASDTCDRVTGPSATTGFYRLGKSQSWALIHASRYRRRPFQADQLHVDFWHRGVNLACDPGTYLYNGAPPWDNGLARTCVHNALTADGEDQMRRAGRFLWVDWSSATRLTSNSSPGTLERYFEGEHNGYDRLGVTHHRVVKFLSDGCWLVIDDARGTGEHEVCLQWLLPDLPINRVSANPFEVSFDFEQTPILWTIFASAPGNASLIRGGKSLAGTLEQNDTRTLGWVSPTYGELKPAVSLVYRVKSSLPVRLITVLLVGPQFRLESNATQISIYQSASELDRISLSPVESVGAREGSN